MARRATFLYFFLLRCVLLYRIGKAICGLPLAHRALAKTSLTIQGTMKKLPLLLVFALSFLDIEATTYTVISTSNANTAGTLRWAVANASNGDTIVFDLPASSVITLSGDPIVITTSCTLDGTLAGGNVLYQLTLQGLSSSFLVKALRVTRKAEISI